jgi:chromosome segregation ATPase
MQEQQLTTEVGRTQALSRELAEARKTSSKLRAHLEDSRQESRRMQDECKAHMEELAERRQQVSKVEHHKRSERDSLLSANAQVAALKAQLEKAVDAKVNKKMGSKLKVSLMSVESMLSRRHPSRKL